ncbi:MAG: hypothetical protein Q9212_004627 [Teloschistes hypoglaucus]
MLVYAIKNLAEAEGKNLILDRRAWHQANCGEGAQNIGLEKAILHRNLRNFFESLAIFDSFTGFLATEPVVCLEHTWTLIAQYRFREAHRIATTGLSALRKSPVRNENHGVAIVLRAFLAGLDALVERSTHGCFESLEEIHDWLKPVAIEDITDVQVWAVNLYYYLPTLTEQTKDTSQFRTIPVPPADSPGSGITLLRKHLQEAGRFNEALFLLDTEIPLLPSKDAEIETMESLRSSCDLESSSTQPVNYIQGAVALKLVLVYAELGDEEAYREEMFNAAAALSVTHEDVGSRSNLLRTDTWLARLELGRATEKEPTPEAWEAFADYASKVEDYRVEVKALTAALEGMINPGSKRAGDVLPENKEMLRERLDVLIGISLMASRSIWTMVVGLALISMPLMALAASLPAANNETHLLLNPASSNRTSGFNSPIDCDGAAYGKDLVIKSCVEAQKLIPTADTPLRFGQRFRQGVDVPTPWRWVSRSSGRLSLTMMSYRPVVSCRGYLSFTGQKNMAEIMKKMSAEKAKRNFGRRGTPGVRVALPLKFTSTNQLFRSQLTATLDLTTTNQDAATWYDIWAATAALDAMCVRRGMAGSASWLGG